MSIAALVILAFVVLHKSQYFGRQRHFCGPVPSYRQGGARLQQRPPQSRRRLHCVKSLPTPVRRLSNPPDFHSCQPPRNGGHCCNLVHRPMRTANWANSVEPQAWQECRAPHTGTHTHICNPSALPDTLSELRALNTYQYQVAKLGIIEGDVA